MPALWHAQLECRPSRETQMTWIRQRLSDGLLAIVVLMLIAGVAYALWQLNSSQAEHFLK
jgi:hypothetical protein